MCVVNLVISGGCRVRKLDLQVERSEIPIYRGCLATRIIIRVMNSLQCAEYDNINCPITTTVTTPQNRLKPF